MTGTDQVWDISRLEVTNPALKAECPSCKGYLNSYVTPCFGCGYERGSASLDLLEQWKTISNAPIPALLEYSYLAEVANRRRLLDGGLGEPEIRRDLWLANRGAEAGLNAWKPKLDAKLNYLGGLQHAPLGEYIHFGYEGGEIVLDGDRSRARLASIKPASVLAVSPYTTVYEVVGRGAFGVCSVGVTVFPSSPPPEGGALKIVFVDAQGKPRLAAIGNRTGLTDKWYSLDAYKSSSCLIGKMCLFQMAWAEWLLGPVAYARSIGIEMPDRFPTRKPAI
jgi:hypothetical protein